LGGVWEGGGGGGKGWNGLGKKSREWTSIEGGVGGMERGCEDSRVRKWTCGVREGGGGGEGGGVV